MIYQDNVLKKLPIEIILKIIFYLDVVNINDLKTIINVPLINSYLIDLILKQCNIKDNKFNLSINFNKNYTLSFSDMDEKNIKNFVSNLLKNKNYKILLNNWIYKIIKF